MSLKIGKPGAHVEINNPTELNELVKEATNQPQLAGRLGTYGKLVDAALRHRLPDRPEAGPGELREVGVTVSDIHWADGVLDMRGDHKVLISQRISRAEEITQQIDRRFRSMMETLWAAAAQGASLLAETDKDGRDIGPASGKPYLVNFEMLGDSFELLQMPAERPDKHFPDGFEENGSPRDTPANDLVKLSIIDEGHCLIFDTLAEHLARGHKVTFIPGNHDLALANPFVWDGDVAVIPDRSATGGYDVIDLTKLSAAERDAVLARPGAERHLGLRGRLRERLAGTHGLQGSALDDALARLSLLPFSVVGGDFHNHGAMCDPTNITARPFKEFVSPTGLRETMPSNFGDWFVRSWFLKAEDHKITLDGKNSALDMVAAMFQPGMAAHRWRMFGAGIRALKANGYVDSPEAEAEQRRADMRELLRRFPQIGASVNEFRWATRQQELTATQVAEGFNRVFDKAGAVGLQQAFKTSESLLKRIVVRVASAAAAKHPAIGKLIARIPGAQTVVRPWDLRSTRGRFKDLAAEVNVELGLSGATVGHTHRPERHTLLTSKLEAADVTNTHTWTPKDSWSVEDRDLVGQAWKKTDAGVKITEIGVDAHGTPYVAARLCKIDEEGQLADGSMYADERLTPKKAAAMRQTFSAMVRDFFAQGEMLAAATTPEAATALALGELTRAGLARVALNGEKDAFLAAVRQLASHRLEYTAPAQLVEHAVERDGLEALRRTAV